MTYPTNPLRVTDNGRPWWLFDDGTRLPVISGGSGDDPDPGTDPGPGTDTGTDPDPGTDWKAEADKWKGLAKKHEIAWRKSSKELDAARQASMSDQEKAVADAEARGRQSTLAEVGHRLAAAEVRAALTGVVPDPAVIVEDLNLARYVTGTGEVDTDAVAKLREKYVGLAAKTPPADLKQGARGDNGPTVEQRLAEAQKAGDWRTVVSLQNQRLTTPK